MASVEAGKLATEKRETKPEQWGNEKPKQTAFGGDGSVHSRLHRKAKLEYTGSAE